MKKIIAAGAALALAFVASPALAAISVTNSATATITNTLAASAQTGANVAAGGVTDATLSGANISGSVGGSFTGFGSTNVSGGNAMVTTGTATAGVTAQNSVNSSDVDIDTEPWVDVAVTSVGVAGLTNSLSAGVHTGLNVVAAGPTTADVSGGNLSGSGWGNHSGIGGTTVAGGDTSVATGATAAASSAINLLNSSILRVR